MPKTKKMICFIKFSEQTCCAVDKKKVSEWVKDNQVHQSFILAIITGKYRYIQVKGVKIRHLLREAAKKSILLVVGPQWGADH